MVKEQIGSNAIFTGPQKGLTIVGDFCYAQSGSVQLTTSDTTMLEFTTGKQLILCDIVINYAEDQADNCFYKIFFNNNQVQGWVVSGGTTASAKQPFPLLIPPLTLVKIVGDMASGSRISYCSLSGKVYS